MAEYVEFVGGPYGGTVQPRIDGARLEDEGAGIVVLEPGETLPDGSYKLGKPRGCYFADGYVSAEILRMRWSLDVPEEVVSQLAARGPYPRKPGTPPPDPSA